MERTYREKRPEAIGKLWRAQSRTRLALSLILGVFVGIALLSLPALVSPTYQAADPDTVVKPQSLSFNGARSAEPSIGSFATGSTSDKLVLAFKLFLILVPGSILSVLARRWATRKLEDYWYY